MSGHRPLFQNPRDTDSVLFCFLLPPPAADWLYLACPPIPKFAQLLSTTSIHNFPPSPLVISISPPCNHCWRAPKTPSSSAGCSARENGFIQAHGQEQPAILHAGSVRWPGFLGEQHIAHVRARVSVWQRWEHKDMQESCGFLIQVLPNPKPAYLVQSHVMLPRVTQLQTYPTHLCAAKTQRRF